MAVVLLSGCATASINSDGVIEIGERFFINQINDITMNHRQFLGRTIQYEGIFRTVDGEGASPDSHFVYRYVPGCCGPEGISGFMVDIGDAEPLETNAWVEVVGVLEEFEDPQGQTRIRLGLASLTELEERGAEFVEP